MFEKEYLALVAGDDVLELYDIDMDTQARNHAKQIGAQVVPIICKEKPKPLLKPTLVKVNDILP